MIRSTLCLGLVLTFAGPSMSQTNLSGRDSLHVESPFSWEYPKLVGRDIGHVVSAPAHWSGGQWLSFTIQTGAVIGTAAALDKSVRTFAQDNRSNTSNKIADQFNRFGSSYPSFALIGFYVGGAVFHKQTAKMVALDGGAATLIASVGITPLLKELFGRHRPYYNDGPFKFSPFSIHESFPSGHSTRAFVTASVIAAHYHQFWIKTVVYTLATMVAYARVNYNVHFASDVLAGAMIGISAGTAVVHFNRQARASD